MLETALVFPSELESARLFLGKVKPDQIWGAVQAAADETARKRRECDADFYIAVFGEQNGDLEQALGLYQSAAKACPEATLESRFIKAFGWSFRNRKRFERRA
jgi:lipoprotein NlpI